MKRTRKLLSILLSLVLLLSLIPANAPVAKADEYNWIEVSTQNAWEIQKYLRMEGDVWIKLSGDADWTLHDADYESYLWHDRWVWTKIGQGVKVIDLNGHRLYVTDNGDAPAQSVMMEIPDGASLNVYDDVGGGMIWMDGQMKFGEDFYGDDGILVRDVFAVTGGVLAINGGEIHAGRAKRVWCNLVTPRTRDWDWGDKYNPGSIYSGYATQFNSGTAVTVEDDGYVVIRGGELWGRGWDNISLISRVPNNGAGADGHRDRCAALRVLEDGEAVIEDGSFYGRSDADAIQVENPLNVTIYKGTFDTSTNDYLATPRTDAFKFTMSDDFYVNEGWLGNYKVPEDSIDMQSGYYFEDHAMIVNPRGGSRPYYEIIDEVDLAINAPLAYETAVTDIEQVYWVPEGCSVKDVTWYENGSIWENPQDSYFKEGYDYTVAVELHVDDRYTTKFARNMSSASINGVDAMVLPAMEDRTMGIILMADFGPCVSAIEEVSLITGAPLDGHTVSYEVLCADDSYAAPVGADYTAYRRWFVSDDGESGWKELGPGDRFKAGKYYRLSVDLVATHGNEFAIRDEGRIVPDVTAKVNGNRAQVLKAYEQDPSNYITVEYDFGQCPAIVDRVELSVTAPKDGETIRYTVNCADDTYYAVGGSSNYTDYRSWYESANGTDGWRMMEEGETFSGGKHYKFVTDIITANGYSFDVYDNGTSIQPIVDAFVNGGQAKVFKGYEQDPSEYITVEYYFGECNDSVIERVMVEDVAPPVAGEKPDYSGILLGSGYRFNTAMDKYYDDWQHNQKLYYIRNGMSWFDVTDGDWVYENETFIAGHEYTLTVYLTTEDGYHFTNLYEHDALPTAAVNGWVADIVEGWSSATETRVTYTFVAGESPMVFTDVPYGSFYYVPVVWAVESGITSGATATTFNPDGECLRAQVVTFLHRAAGSPVPPTSDNPFTDVKETDFFYKPVLWAVSRGITNGVSATSFGAYDVCNRAAVVTFLWRACGSPEPESTDNPFVDVKETDFFYKPVLWAVENGITNGIDATHFGPGSPCNRAQVVTFLYRAFRNY